MEYNNTLTALNGVRVGHSTHTDKLTGCTVVLFDTPYSVAYTSYGGGPATYNTDTLKSGKTDYTSNGLFITGGSSTGLMTGASLTECLRNDGVGIASGVGKQIFNPSISGAVVYDLGMQVAPFDLAYGAEAYNNATNATVKAGNVGAGTGTSVGKFRWLENGTKTGGMKTGVGNARIDVGNGIIVCALSVVNAIGNVVLPDGTILAGNRDEQKRFKLYNDVADFITADTSNTTISIVGINVDMHAKEHLEKIAHHGAQGQIRAIEPVNLSSDGDTVFVFSTAELVNPFNSRIDYFSEIPNNINVQVDIIGDAAAKAVRESIYDACRQAQTIQYALAYNGIIPCAADY